MFSFVSIFGATMAALLVGATAGYAYVKPALRRRREREHHRAKRRPRPDRSKPT